MNATKLNTISCTVTYEHFGSVSRDVLKIAERVVAGRWSLYVTGGDIDAACDDLAAALAEQFAEALEREGHGRDAGRLVIFSATVTE